MAENLTLYFDLEEKQLADIEVISRASLAWSVAIKDIASHVDPGLQISVQLESGTKGSLSLNSLVKQVGPYVSDPRNIRIAIVTTLIYITHESGAWTIGKALDHLSSNDIAPIVQSLSEVEKRELAEAVVEELEAKTGRDNLALVFQEAKKDRSIKGIGATTVKSKRPRNIISREEFDARFSEPIEMEDAPEARQLARRMKVVLIWPALFRWSNCFVRGSRFV